MSQQIKIEMTFVVSDEVAPKVLQHLDGIRQIMTKWGIAKEVVEELSSPHQDKSNSKDQPSRAEPKTRASTGGIAKSKPEQVKLNRLGIMGVDPGTIEVNGVWYSTPTQFFRHYKIQLKDKGIARVTFIAQVKYVSERWNLHGLEEWKDMDEWFRPYAVDAMLKVVSLHDLV